MLKNTSFMGHVLLVEDNLSDVDLTKRAFQKNHIPNEIRVARDGEEALQLLLHTYTNDLKQMEELPVFILLDLNLPKIHGIDVLKEIRRNERTACIPVIVLTTSTEEQDRIASYNYGANSYIQKPVDFDQFLDVIHQIGVYWLHINETAHMG